MKNVCLAILSVLLFMPLQTYREELQITGGLIRKRLPAYTIFAIDPHTDFNSRLVARTTNGISIELGRELDLPTQPPPSHKLIDFFVRQEFNVREKEDALEIVNLIEYIRLAPNKARMLKVNSKNYTLFDESLYEIFVCDKQSWELIPTKISAGWRINPKYVGHGSAMEHPVYIIEVDNRGYFKNLRTE